jgi:HD-GYP domain-containing protein (c-di-GMP phosphodiesterase class II)
VGILLAVLIGLRIHQAVVQRREQNYVRRLEETQEYLHRHIAKLDALVAMLSGLYRKGLSGGGAAPREDLYRAIVDSACKLLSAPKGCLMLLDGETLRLRIAAAQGLSPETIESLTLRLGEGIAGRVAETGQPIFVDDIRLDKRFLRMAQTELESEAMASVPLRVKNRVLGVLNVNGASGQRFEDRDLRLLGVLADQAAATLENYGLYEDLQRFTLDTVQTLMQALDAKESPNARRAGRARELARAVARELSLPDQIVEYVEYAAMMRDVGKIGVDNAILHKPGRLTVEEYAEVKKHPEIGSRILSPVAFLAPVISMVLYHREWYNGQGYPEGLSGEEIPLGARIVAVVGAWEAMRSDRPYRKALSREKAVEELRNGSGTQFDPKVVDAFLTVISKETASPPAAATA